MKTLKEAIAKAAADRFAEAVSRELLEGTRSQTTSRKLNRAQAKAKVDPKDEQIMITKDSKHMTIKKSALDNYEADGWKFAKSSTQTWSKSKEKR